MRAPVCKATTEFCYRLNKGEFANQLAKILARYPKYQCEGPTAVSPELKLASALRWLAGGAYVDAADVHGQRQKRTTMQNLIRTKGVTYTKKGPRQKITFSKFPPNPAKKELERIYVYMVRKVCSLIQKDQKKANGEGRWPVSKADKGATFFVHLWDTLEKLNAVENVYFPLDDAEKLDVLSAEFSAGAGGGTWVGSIGALDGVVFKTQKPKWYEVKNVRDFYCARKHEWGINVQAICSRKCINQRFVNDCLEFNIG